MKTSTYRKLNLILAAIYLLLLSAAFAHAQEKQLYLECRETVTGQMAIVLPPEMKNDKEQSRKAIAQCRSYLENKIDILDMVFPKGVNE